GIVRIHRVGEPLLDARAVPARGLPLPVHAHRVGPRQPLRPVAERTVGPHVHVADLADRPLLDVLDRRPRLGVRVPLVAHLRGDLRVRLGLAGEHARLFDRPAQRLLHVDVLAEIHRRGRDRRVHVIGRGDDHRVDVLLLVEHLAVVAVLFDLRYLVDEALQHLGRLTLARRIELGILAALRLPGGRGRRVAPPLELLRVAIERPLRVIPVDVADGDDVLAGDGAEVVVAHAADADGGDVEQVARRCEASPEYVARDDEHARAGDGGALDELPARHAVGLELVHDAPPLRVVMIYLPRMSRLTRREWSAIVFGGLAAAPFSRLRAAAAAPDSTVAGVRLGTQSYSFRDRTIDQMILNMAVIGLTYCELWQAHVEP